MDIIFNLMLTCAQAVFIMFAVDLLAGAIETDKLREVTKSYNYQLVGGSFILLTGLFAFIWVLMLIWS